MICYSNLIITYFKKSHQANALLKQFIDEYYIIGGGLKIYIETRWTSVYDCVSSIIRLKRCLEEVFNFLLFYNYYVFNLLIIIFLS